MNLYTLGWNDFFRQFLNPFQEKYFKLGRVAVENKNNCLILSEYGELTGEISGKLLYSSENAADLPKVGDWVVMTVFEAEQKAIIHEVLPRKTKFVRKVAGKKNEEQVIATNIDYLFIVQSLDNNFNLRRLERYLLPAYQSGASPVIILNKADLCRDVEQKLLEVQQIALDVPVIPLSSLYGLGLEELDKFIQPQKTIAFVGSSGVGKSTLINRLRGKEIQKTQEVRSIDSKGRHTTTVRELILLDNGALLIDTPGMREFQLWDVEEGLEETFADIEALTDFCHFRDCTHSSEIKCAVLEAVESGEITVGRYKSYLKLQRELKYLEESQDKQAYLREKEKRFKHIHKQMKKMVKKRN